MKANCKENQVCTSSDIVVLGPSDVFYIIYCGFMRKLIRTTLTQILQMLIVTVYTYIIREVASSAAAFKFA